MVGSAGTKYLAEKLPNMKSLTALAIRKETSIQMNLKVLIGDWLEMKM